MFHFSQWFCFSEKTLLQLLALSKALLPPHTSFFSLCYQLMADFLFFLYFFFSFLPFLFLHEPGGRRGHPWEVSGSAFSLPTFSSHFPTCKEISPHQNLNSQSWEKPNHWFNNEAVGRMKTIWFSDAVGKKTNICPPCLSLCLISFPFSVVCRAAAALFLTLGRRVCAKTVITGLWCL